MYRCVEAFHMTLRAACLEALHRLLRSATVSRVHALTRSALALARFSSRRFRRAARLCSEFIEGTPHGLQCGSDSRLR